MTSARRGSAVVAVALLGACGGSSVEGVQIDDAWARPTPAGATVAAVYFELETGAGDRLLAARVDPTIAASAELHATATNDATGEAAMRQLDGVPVEPGSDLAFEPGQNHVMLVDVAQPLATGTTFEMTVDLEQAGPQVVTVTVRDGPP